MPWNPLRARTCARLLAAALLAATAGFAPNPGLAVEVPAVMEAPPEERVMRTPHLVVISIDGLRVDAIDRFGAATLQRLMREGAYSLEAQTILPSKTLPSHTSMVTGVGPEVHGITWNGDHTLWKGTVRVPTMFGVARAAGHKTAAFFSKSKFHHLEVPGTLDHVESPFGWDGTWTADRTVAQVRDDLAKAPWNLVFVHFGEPDYAGHAHGWMTAQYAQAVRRADEAVAEVLHEADAAFGAGNYTVIVTADHGGDELGHGMNDVHHRTIPWIAWGHGVRGGQVLPAGIRTTDTAATALWALGVGVPADWQGRPVAAAFR